MLLTKTLISQMIKKANYKPTLPIFGERFLADKAKSVRFEEEYDSEEHQYDSLYDNHMKDYFSRPKIKKRLVKLGLTDSTGNPIGNKSVERNALKKKQLLKEREEVVKKIRMREADRIARMATGSNKVTKSCVACESHNRMLAYLRTHMCPIHSNVTYQRAKDTLMNSAAHDGLANEDNLAKLEVENKTLKNLWYNEVLRMEEESLQEQLGYEKRRLQQVLSELRKLKQQKEATEMENLDQIKINLYSKIKRRLGLQALLTTLREVEDGDVNSVPQDTDSKIYNWSPQLQPNGSGLSFQYLPPSSPAAAPRLTDIRPSSAPIGSEQVTSNSDLLPDQPSFQYDEQLKKRPSSSRGYRGADNRGPYSRTPPNLKQTANIISPLVSTVTNMPQQLSSTLRSSSILVNEPPINKGDVDDDTMPLDEADTMLEGLSSNETSSVNITTSDQPIALRNKIPARRQAYSVTADSALTPRPTIPTLHSIPTIHTKAKQSSEKRVNFMIDSVPPPSSDSVPPSSRSDLSSMITEIIENAREQCVTTQDEADDAERSTSDVFTADNVRAKSAEKIDDPSETTADTAETENDPNSIFDPADEQVNVVANYQNFEQPQTASQLNNDADKGQEETKQHDPTGWEPTDIDPLAMEEMIAANKPDTVKKLSKLSLKKSSFLKAGNTGQPKKLKNSSSVKKLVAKTSKQFDPAKSKKNTTAAKQQTSKKSNKTNQDWKKTILQKVKK